MASILVYILRVGIISICMRSKSFVWFCMCGFLSVSVCGNLAHDKKNIEKNLI